MFRRRNLYYRPDPCCPGAAISLDKICRFAVTVIHRTGDLAEVAPDAGLPDHSKPTVDAIRLLVPLVAAIKKRQKPWI